MIREIQPTTGISPPEAPARRAATASSGAAFASVLSAAVRRSGDIRFSAHAIQRIERQLSKPPG